MDTLARWALGALLVAVALVAVTLAWARMTQVDQPEAVLRIMPWHSGALLETAEKSRLGPSASTAEIDELGKQVLRMAPLLDAPLVYAGFDRAANGDETGAHAAFQAAVRRQPRNVPALSWLATAAMKAGDYPKVVALLDQLWRVDPGNRSSYANAFSSIATVPRGAALLESELVRSSPLAVAAAEKLIPLSNDIGMLMRLAATTPSFQQKILDRIAREQGMESAFVAWLSFLPSSDAQRLSWPFDPVFVGSDAPPPFNWQLMSDAEWLREGGLLVRYSGRGNPTFARQAMLLGPGVYRFAAEMDGEMSGQAGEFVWEIQCLPDQSVIGAVRVSTLSLTLSTQTALFSVPPSGCRAQMLSLKGKPGAFTARARATVRQVTIRASGSGAQ
jgi:hypothetical protein